MDIYRASASISRRSAVAGLAASGFLLAAGGKGVLGQDATPSALPASIREWIAGWQARDPDRIAAIYAEDGYHEVIATGQILTGPEAIRANIAGLIEAVPDATLQANQVFAVADAGVVDWSFAGHYTNPYPGFPPPTGQPLAFRAAIIFALEGDMVVRTSEFYDLFGLFVQLGVLPPPGGEMTPEASPAV